ncbi:MAG: PFL family protein [Anaerolineae bacterium]
MDIRSVTAFVEARPPITPAGFEAAGSAVRAARAALTDAGYTVQSARLAIQAFPDALPAGQPGLAVELAKDLEAVAFVNEIDYVALGPVRAHHSADYLDALVEVLAQTENTFASIEIADPQQGISLPRLRQTAEIIRQVARLKGDGFKNLYLTALANVPPWSPFLPAAYHGGGPARLAVATESADLAIDAITGANSPAEAAEHLTRRIEAEAARIEGAVRAALGAPGSLDFAGIDFSLAPFPDNTRSIGRALEALGLAAFGGQGSLAAAAFLTDALDRASFQRAGFCSLMLPVLEDSVLAERASQGLLSISDLLTCSAVCGTGLDLIALPGDVSAASLSAILLDVGALALRLDKPLTARLMPLPGKQAGDPVTFDFEYFAASRVLPAPAESLVGLLAGEDTLFITPRNRQG